MLVRNDDDPPLPKQQDYEDVNEDDVTMDSNENDNIHALEQEFELAVSQGCRRPSDGCC